MRKGKTSTKSWHPGHLSELVVYSQSDPDFCVQNMYHTFLSRDLCVCECAVFLHVGHESECYWAGHRTWPDTGPDRISDRILGRSLDRTFSNFPEFSDLWEERLTDFIDRPSLCSYFDVHAFFVWRFKTVKIYQFWLWLTNIQYTKRSYILLPLITIFSAYC